MHALLIINCLFRAASLILLYSCGIFKVGKNKVGAALMINLGKNIMKYLVFVLLLIPLIATAEVYKWVDDFGKVHYSDQPHSTTDKPIDLPESMIYKAPAKPKFKLDKPQTKKPYKFYETFKVVSPQSDGTVRNNSGNLSVSLQISPALRSNHFVIVTVDGKPTPKGKSSMVTASDVFQGTHSVGARIVDENGKTITSAPSITFHMKRFGK